MKLTIHTDGGARDNGKSNSVAAYGACARWDDNRLLKKFTIVQRVDSETNNQMELRAVIVALKIALKQNDTEIVSIVMDSAYVRNGLLEWVDGWKRNDWLTSQKKPVKNKLLWQQLDRLYKEADSRLVLSLDKVKGHSKVYENEHIDSACTWAMNHLGNNEIKAEWSFKDSDEWDQVWIK
ncbi:ribonuclease H family protein [Enterococcus mundtii]|uniref:ribonuclease H family protein n=1 Tax=Enterococcus mundtii TaxID=53346 RepID=UPI001A965B1F|nr:ribonuclease H [Enterococcus mundtii]MBO1087161.1 ribonuclease HI [Enterococcus mundtii]